MKGIKADIFKQFLYLMGFVNQNENYRKISFQLLRELQRIQMYQTVRLGIIQRH